MLADMLACLSHHKKPLLVGLEIPSIEQTYIDHFIDSDGSENEVETVLERPFWTGDFKDGRTSTAMFSLIESIRKLRASNRSIDVVCYAPNPDEASENPDIYEQIMDHHIKKSEMARRYQQIVVYGGNIHLMPNAPIELKITTLGRRMQKRHKNLLALDMSWCCGESWLCHGPAPEDCGVKKLIRNRPGEEREIWLGNHPNKASGYHGGFHIGNATASLPIVTKTIVRN